MGTSDWYARKLGQPQAPRHDTPAPAYQPPQYQPQYQPAPQPQTSTPSTGRWDHQSGESVLDAAARNGWQGGQAARTERALCPKCGGSNFFSRTNGLNRGPAPAPSCWDCGYNGLFEQFGDSSE